MRAGYTYTHGAFGGRYDSWGGYRHFESKDDLAVKASERPIADTKAVIVDELSKKPSDPLRVLIERYVSSSHRDDPGTGCILPALAADAARRDDPALRQVFTASIQEYLDQLGLLLAARSAATGDRRPATGARTPAAILAEMVGAVILSRVVTDEGLAGSLMADVIEDIVGD